jgi:hypothetical protein
MAGNEGKLWFQRPIATRSMKIGVAHATCFRLDEYLSRPDCGYIPFLQYQWFAELLDNSGLHFF